MEILEFIASLEKDRAFQLQVSGRRYIQPCSASFLEAAIDERIRHRLKARGIKSIYSHQAHCLDLVRKGDNIVVMTPTASGKSLVYNVPVLESVLEDPQAKALYIFPVKGLEQDQLAALNSLSEPLGLGRSGEVYDGDTPAGRKKEIRESMPSVIFTNPDMIHLAILPFHRKWEGLFRNLRYVVVDEIHSYKGVFGSHVAQIFRRLRRICSHYGSDPRFIAASATIANPEGHAETLTGVGFRVVSESGAPSSGRHFFFVNPIESPYTVSCRVFVQCLRAGMRTILFTKSRKITELIYKWTLDKAPEFRDRISPYRAGFLPEERREIEARLFSGELLGVISTSALELGVDIGGLDCCILCGYPGSVSATWQRAGRVGREERESLVFLVADRDALDQYFVRHPDEFLGKPHEASVTDPDNKNILRRHLLCAAAELPLSRSEETYDIEKIMPHIEALTVEGALSEGKKGGIWTSKAGRPHRDVSIRAVGERFLLTTESGRSIGDLGGARVFREAFPGAVYLHRGKQYVVARLDLTARRASCREFSSGYYTVPVTEGATEVLEELENRRFGGLGFSWGRLRIRQRVIAYDKKRNSDSMRLSTHPLDMPEYVFESEGLWTVIDQITMQEVTAEGFDLGGTLHAVEHASIACMPFFALCDRNDIGGLSHTCYPAFNLPAIFIYDGHEGGVGLSRTALEIVPEWLKATLKVLEECPCTGGCPSCVQDPHCGNRNEPLDKEGAKFLIRKWMAKTD